MNTEFIERVRALRVNPKAIEEIRVHDPFASKLQVIRNNDESIQIFASIISNDGHINAESARQGLAVYGQDLRKKANDSPARFPEIEILERIARSHRRIRADIIRKESSKSLPVNLIKKLPQALDKYPTPFYIYDESGIRDTARRFKDSFSWVSPSYMNYFAVKACPNPHIVKILSEEGFGADCSSLPELVISERVGLKGEQVMFTSNDTPAEEYVKARQLGALINMDDITHIEYLQKSAGIPELVCFRYNPGPLRKGNSIIGDPVEAKYGLTKDQIIDAYRAAREKGARRFGLHTMVVSNMLDERYLIDTAVMLFELAVEIHHKLGIKFQFINLGGGFGTPYKPEQVALDLNKVSNGVHDAYSRYIEANGLAPLRVVTECGRAITGPNGFMVTRVRHVTRKYKDYVGLDACMANLMRPALYGAYHHITVLDKKGSPKDHIYDVTGSLCENNDKFAINRPLPEIKPDDVLVFHNCGAHGHAMGFQYNGKLRSAELLLKTNGTINQIRRAEKIEDYLNTIETWPR